jgi:hypothetical protein
VVDREDAGARLSCGRGAAVLALGAGLLAAARPSAAQDLSEGDYARVAGCYAIERSAQAPWLAGVEPNIRLTMEPLRAEPGTGPQYVVRSAAREPTVAPLYSYLSWSLFAGGQLVSIVWSTDENMIGLTFAPEPERPNVRAIGSTTFFSHEMMRESPPVDVGVTAIAC